MDLQQAVYTINNFASARLYAELDEADGSISGGVNPTLVDWLDGLEAFYGVEEAFRLYPSEQYPDLWAGVADRYGHECLFSPATLEDLVQDICDFYTVAEEFDNQPQLVIELMTSLSRKDFFFTRDGAGGITILGSQQENFVSPDFSIVRFGKFFVGIDIKNGPKYFTNSPVIVCSRSIQDVVEAIAAHFSKSDA